MAKRKAEPALKVKDARRSLALLEKEVVAQLEVKEVWLDEWLTEVDCGRVQDDVARREYFKFLDTQLGIARFGDIPRLALRTTTRWRVYAGEDLECVLRGSSFIVPVLDTADDLQLLAFDHINDLLMVVGARTSEFPGRSSAICA
jgi:hypothetical protein